jgi:hypothetical protein
MIKTVFMAILIMSNGTPITASMDSMESCLSFTRTIAPYVYTADCESYSVYDVSASPSDYFPPEP